MSPPGRRSVLSGEDNQIEASEEGLLESEFHNPDSFRKRPRATGSYDPSRSYLLPQLGASSQSQLVLLSLGSVAAVLVLSFCLLGFSFFVLTTNANYSNCLLAAASGSFPPAVSQQQANQIASLVATEQLPTLKAKDGDSSSTSKPVVVHLSSNSRVANTGSTASSVSSDASSSEVTLESPSTDELNDSNAVTEISGAAGNTAALSPEQMEQFELWELKRANEHYKVRILPNASVSGQFINAIKIVTIHLRVANSLHYFMLVECIQAFSGAGAFISGVPSFQLGTQ